MPEPCDTDRGFPQRDVAFMTAGEMSCIPATAAVWALVKREVFLAYVALGLGGAVFSGLVFGAVAG